MSIRVHSEIGRLERVLVHDPGMEIDWMAPSMMEDLLFDDILYGEQARAEHRAFCAVLQSAGVETLDPQTLLRETLEDAESGAAHRSDLLDRLVASAAAPAAREHLESLDAAGLAAAAVTGVRNQGGYASTETALYHVPPLPNYFFQRDPQFVVGDLVFVAAMATAARRREPVLAEAVFRHHPKLAGYSALFCIADESPSVDYPMGGDRPSLEGGDVILADSETILVGLSERSNLRGVERLAEYLRGHETPFRHLIMVDLPAQRSYMHLDTVFTIVDEGQCLAYLPVIQPSRRLSAQAFYVDLGARELSFSLRPSLLDALAGVGIDLEPIPCGSGDDVLDQAREQWTDGANAFCVAPGVILLYRRNRHTVDELARRGWRVVEQEEVIAGRRQILGEGPTVVTIPGNELSRARGGPRCMTMPLERRPPSG